MKGAELIGRRVLDRDGTSVGHVHDLVFTQRGQDAPRFELVGLECGKAGLGDRLGYLRGSMAGPWPLPALFRWLGRHSLFVEWSQVRALHADRVELAVARVQLCPFREVSR
ncbi:PRC-barrel domain-containing protein [Amycolatopsis dongchuanensis]|uniref:PRC-barrel domain-containing protein n=1 Tax=Amycolatopsis dongchuanensis TaxID=1070866 RepID=A0ABP9QN03_9PSEU